MLDLNTARALEELEHNIVSDLGLEFIKVEDLNVRNDIGIVQTCWIFGFNTEQGVKAAGNFPCASVNCASHRKENYISWNNKNLFLVVKVIYGICTVPNFVSIPILWSVHVSTPVADPGGPGGPGSPNPHFEAPDYILRSKLHFITSNNTKMFKKLCLASFGILFKFSIDIF